MVSSIKPSLPLAVHCSQENRTVSPCRLELGLPEPSAGTIEVATVASAIDIRTSGSASSSRAKTVTSPWCRKCPPQRGHNRAPYPGSNLMLAVVNGCVTRFSAYGVGCYLLLGSGDGNDDANGQGAGGRRARACLWTMGKLRPGDPQPDGRGSIAISEVRRWPLMTDDVILDREPPRLVGKSRRDEDQWPFCQSHDPAGRMVVDPPPAKTPE